MTLTLPNHQLATAAQSASRVVMIRPHRFSPNRMTTADNAFQSAVDHQLPAQQIADAAHREVTGLAQQLESAGVGVDLFEDHSTSTPDSVFPNNWFTTHSDGRLVLYPMYAQNRRGERRADIVEHLKRHYRVWEVRDYSPAEEIGGYLEGTGAMVLDHLQRRAYACYSNRLTPTLFFRWCREFGYEPVLFHAADSSGTPVYHTNVLLSVGTSVALVGAELIAEHHRQDVLDQLRAGGREVIELTEDQIRKFAGNTLELAGSSGPVMAMSTTSLASLRSEQRGTLQRHCEILAAEVPTIESAGGSVRCMLAGIHLERSL